MKKLKIILPFFIIIATALVIYIILSNPPKAKKEKVKQAKIQVNVQKIKKQNYDIKLDSYGTAQASVKSTLSSQVSGKIIFVNEKFKNGAYFKKGDLLVQIEDLDYKADVKVAQAQLILAKQALIEEQAMAKQAKEDWERFNIDQKPNDLVLRVPQLQSAKANLLAAQANLDKAKLNLKRTKITAPYDGRVIEKSISISQVIASNTQIGTIFSTDAIEVRLPLKNKDLRLIDISKNGNVEFVSEVSKEKFIGQIKRSESTIDENTKQLYLISEIKQNSHKIKLGEYLIAKIQAKTLKDIIVIPNDTIYQSSYVYIEKDGVLKRKYIDILWQNNEQSIISKGLEENENLVLTTLGIVSSGTRVQIANKKRNR